MTTLRFLDFVCWCLIIFFSFEFILQNEISCVSRYRLCLCLVYAQCLHIALGIGRGPTWWSIRIGCNSTSNWCRKYFCSRPFPFQSRYKSQAFDISDNKGPTFNWNGVSFGGISLTSRIGWFARRLNEDARNKSQYLRRKLHLQSLCQTKPRSANQAQTIKGRCVLLLMETRIMYRQEEVTLITISTQHCLTTQFALLVFRWSWSLLLYATEI